MKRKGIKKVFPPRYSTIGQSLFVFSLVGFTIYYSESKKDISSPSISQTYSSITPLLAQRQTNSNRVGRKVLKESYPGISKSEEELSMERVTSNSGYTPNTTSKIAGVSQENVIAFAPEGTSSFPFLEEGNSKGNSDPAPSNEYPSSPSEHSYNSPCISLLRVRNLEGRGIGYNHGYSTLEGLIFPIHTEYNLWPFLDLRFHYFNNNEFAANGGLGVRYNADKQKIIYGLNVYYDYRSDHHQSLNFNQLGAGFELLWKELDFRINGYFPLENEKTRDHRLVNDKDTHSLRGREKVTAALSGFNAEFGRSIVKVENLAIYGAIGPYYYGGDVPKNTFGVQFRLNMLIAEYITLEGRVTYDHLFNTRGEGIIGLNFPLGCPKSKKSVQKSLTQHVERNEIIVLDKYNKWKTN